MKKLASFFLINSLILPLCSPCFAQQSVVKEPDPGEVIAPIKLGHAAPFSGVVMSPRATAKMIAELSGINDKILIEVQKTKDDLTAKHKAEMSDTNSKCEKKEKDLQADVELKSKEIKIKDSEISYLDEQIRKKESETPSRATWAGIGFAGGIVATILTVFVVNKAINK